MAKVIILSGAGISAESGISTFRDSGGIWDTHRVEDVCSAGCLETNRAETIEFYDTRRIELQDKEPNHAHKMIAKLKERYKDDIAIITQNVDNLFEKAGIPHNEVVHLHGYITNLECEECGKVYDIGYKKATDSFNGQCPSCSSPKVRPFIVMFGEAAPKYQELYDEFNDCEMLVAIGTSGTVVNPDMFLNKNIKISILNNLEESDAINENLYSKALFKPASQAIDEIADEIIKFLDKK